MSVCHDISLFRAAPPADRLPGIATGLARQAARLLIAFSAALTAVDLDAARDAQTAIQAELEGVPSAEQLEEVLGELRDIATGTDQRVGVALAREGSFTDAYGAIDLARVFWAYRGAGDPFLAVGRRAAKYFEPLLSVELDVEDIPHAALLARPLLQVVAMDHPLVAHRLTRETHELFRAAVAADRDAVDAVRRDLATRGDALLAAHERSHTAALELSDPADELDNTVLDRLLALYRDATDDLWQPYVDVLDRLAEIADTDAAAATRTLRATIEPVLLERSTVFAWAVVDEELHVLHEPTGHSWSVYDFASELDRLITAIAGADAGCCLGILSEDLLASDEPVGRASIGVLVRTLAGPAGVQRR